jgi:superfamily II DNA or RNA helicase
VKLESTTQVIEVSPYPEEPWFVQLSFPYHEALKDALKQYPGIHRWLPSRKVWLAPIESLDFVTETGAKHGFVTRGSVEESNITVDFGPENALHEYQRRAVTAALMAPGRRWLFNEEMGLGKTPMAIEAAQAIYPYSVLIVCPAMVRSTWVRELDKWWPKHPEVGLITAGRGRKTMPKAERARLDAAYAAPIQVVSYNLVPQLIRRRFDAIILDEVHRLAAPNSGWSKSIRKLVRENYRCAVFGLTGTLIPNQPVNAWSPLDAIWPERFGRIQRNGRGCFKFNSRYSVAHDNGYGLEYKGINEAYAPELRQRLSSLSSRTTKAEVAHLLPPFNITYAQVEPQSRRKYGKYHLSSDQDWRSHKETVSACLLKAGEEKIPHVMEWYEGAKHESSHICIMGHLKATAQTISERISVLDKNTAVYCITGDLPPEKRNELLAEAQAKPRSVVCATMHSIGIGIDLTGFPVALFAELYYRPETVVQALGRFSRLSGTVPSSVTILSLSGTLDEIVAENVRRKVEAYTELIEAGASEFKLEFALRGGESEQDLMKSLALTARGMIEDPYDFN